MLLAHVRSVYQKSLVWNGFDTAILSQLQITSAEPGRITCEIPVQRENTNRLGTAHGGWLATIVDVAGSLSVASHGFDRSGVSADINVSYLAAAKLGDTLRVEATCRKLGRNLAFTQVDLRTSADKLVATGRHTKFLSDEAHATRKPIGE